MAEKTTHTLQLLPLPENGLLTPEAALKWLEDEHGDYQDIAVWVYGDTEVQPSKEEYLATYYLGTDLSAMVRACAEAIRTEQPVAVSRFEFGLADQPVHLARLLGTLRTYGDYSVEEIAPAFTKLSAELVRRLTSPEGLQLIGRLNGSDAPASP